MRVPAQCQNFPDFQEPDLLGRFANQPTSAPASGQCFSQDEVYGVLMGVFHINRNRLANELERPFRANDKVISMAEPCGKRLGSSSNGFARVNRGKVGGNLPWRGIGRVMSTGRRAATRQWLPLPFRRGLQPLPTIDTNSICSSKRWPATSRGLTTRAIQPDTALPGAPS